MSIQIINDNVEQDMRETLHGTHPLVKYRMAMEEFIGAVGLKHVVGNGMSPLTLTEAFLGHVAREGTLSLDRDTIESLSHPTREISDLAMHLAEAPRTESAGDWLPLYPGAVEDFRHYWVDGQRCIANLYDHVDVEWEEDQKPAGTLLFEADSARRIGQRRLGRSIEALHRDLTASFGKARLRKAISGYGEVALDPDQLREILAPRTKRRFSQWDMVTVASELFPESMAYPHGEHGPQLVVDADGVKRMDRFRREAGITEDPFEDMANEQIDRHEAYEAYQRWEQAQKLAPLVPQGLTGPTRDAVSELEWYMFTSRFVSAEEIYISEAAHKRYLSSEDEDGEEV